MPLYSALFLAFTFASIGLPGMTGFVGEFHALMGAWRGGTTLYQTTAIISTTVVIFSAWYMLWLYQRVAQGVPMGMSAVDDHSGHGAHASHGDDGSGGRAPHDGHVPHDHDSPGGHDDHGHGEAHGRWPDLKPRELATLVPLLALTIIFGVYPGPVFALASNALANILRPFDGGASAAALGQ
jgi:NADH-quinone oxidoreductase subunit M